MSDEQEPDPTRDATVTCHTDGCGNEDAPILINVPDVPAPYVVCGVCGLPITDIK